MKIFIFIIVMNFISPLISYPNIDLRCTHVLNYHNFHLYVPVFITSENTITLFNKELQFGMRSDEFKPRFNEFKLESNEGNDLNYKFETNYSDFRSSNYWITATFKDNKLVCLELNGWQTEEYMKLIKATIKQLIFDKTVKEENEDIGTTETDFYHKDDLKAEYYEFETAVLKICLNN